MAKTKLEELLALPPSTRLFGAVLRHLEKKKSKKDMDAELALVEKALARWPDAETLCTLDTYWLSLPKDPRQLALVRRLTVRELPPGQLKAFVSQPALSSLVHLDISSPEEPLTAETILPLLTSPHMSGLQELTLFRCGLDATALEALKQADLPDLKRLNLGYNGIDDQALEVLLQSPLFEQLESMRLNINQITATGIKGLAAATSSSRLTHLSLASNPLGKKGAEALANMPLLRELRELALSSCELNAQALHTLVSSPRVENLAWLDLSHNKVGDEGANSIASSPHLKGLQELYLSGTSLTAAGAVAFADLSQLPSLRDLHLYNNRLGDQAAEAFASSPFCAQLEMLELRECELTEEGIAALAASPYTPDQSCLDLLNTLEKPGLVEVAKKLALKGRNKLKLEDLRAAILQHKQTLRAQLDETQRQTDLAQFQSSKTTPEDDLSQLRALLSQEPSVEAFQEILQLFTYNMTPENKEISTRYALEHLASWPPETRLANLTTLWEDIDYRDLAAHHELAQALIVDYPALVPDQAQTLIESPLMQHIQHLDLSQTDLLRESIEVIASSPEIKHLVSLNVSRPNAKRFEISGSEIAEIIKSEQLQGLRHLNAGYNRYYKEDLLNLAQGPYMKNLEHLELAQLKKPNENIFLSFLRALPQTKLKRLDLCGNRFGPKAARAIAKCESLRELEALILSGNAIGEEGAIALAESAQLTQLKELRLEGCHIGDEGITALVVGFHEQGLVALDLGNNQLGLDGIHALTDAAIAETLEELLLHNNPFGDEGLRALMDASLPRLRKLSLFANQLSEDALQTFASSELLGQLDVLYMPPDQLTMAELAIMGMAPALSPDRRRPFLSAIPQTQLKQLAAEKKLKGRSKMTKDVLIEALLYLSDKA